MFPAKAGNRRVQFRKGTNQRLAERIFSMRSCAAAVRAGDSFEPVARKHRAYEAVQCGIVFGD